MPLFKTSQYKHIQQSYSFHSQTTKTLQNEEFYLRFNVDRDIGYIVSELFELNCLNVEYTQFI